MLRNTVLTEARTSPWRRSSPSARPRFQLVTIARQPNQPWQKTEDSSDPRRVSDFRVQQFPTSRLAPTLLSQPPSNFSSVYSSYPSSSYHPANQRRLQQAAEPSPDPPFPQPQLCMCATKESESCQEIEIFAEPPASACSIVAPYVSIRQHLTTMWRLPLAERGKSLSDWPLGCLQCPPEASFK